MTSSARHGTIEGNLILSMRLFANFGTPDQCELALRPGVNTLGRDAGNDFNIDHDSVSPAHCRIVVEGDSVRVQDLGSTAGTFIDSAPVQDSALQSGQTLTVGQVNLLFDADTPADFDAVPRAGDPPLPPRVSSAQPVLTTFAMCRNHRDVEARLHCPKCNGNYCELCVASRGGKYYCRRCGIECAILEPVEVVEEAPPGFFSIVSGAFIYPFQGDGIILMIVGTICYAFLNVLLNHGGMAMVGFLSGGAFILLAIFAGGYFFAYMSRIITSTAQGDKTMPDWPDFGGWGDVAGPFFQYTVVIVGSLLPYIIPSLMASNHVEWAPALIIPGLCLGAFYLPMSFLAVTMYDNAAAMNPLLVIPSIMRVWKEYLIVCGVLFVVLIVSRLLNWGLGAMDSGFFISLALYLPSSFITLYCATVEMRILGLLYRDKKDELGWGT